MTSWRQEASGKDQIYHTILVIIWSSSLLTIRMKLATTSDINNVLDCHFKDFMPGEPLSRSMGFVKEGRVEMGNV